MRICSTIITCLAFASIAGCERAQTELLLANPRTVVDAEIVLDIVDLLGDDAAVAINLTDSQFAEEAALDALISGQADLALVSNTMPYRSGISTAMPLYPTVLHVGHVGEREFRPGIDYFRGAQVYAGPKGSASRIMFERYISQAGLAPEEISFSEGAEELSEIFVVFAPISPERLAMYPGVRLVTNGSYADIGTGSAIDAITLLNPQLRPFVIPVGTYGAATPTPILTVAVDMMLVARSDLDASIVYDLVRELNRLRPALASRRPGLFRPLADDFNAANSTFVLHPGLVAYLDRNEPSIYERYSGVAEVVVTVLVALFSATFAGVRIYHMRRKNRIDTFYTDVIAIRNSLDESSSSEDRVIATKKIRDLQNTAFEMLVDEKLSADESFRIFVSLSNDALRDLGAMTADSRVNDS